MRYSIQKNLPRFLLYNNHLEKDLNFVNENIEYINDEEAQKFIIKQRNKLRLQSKTRTRADDPDGAGGDMTDPID